jgi:phage shock protein PspC (stress-responsive transcriptional regulator)
MERLAPDRSWEAAMEEHRSRLRDSDEWTRDVPGRKLAGVCAATAENLGVSVSVVRAVFLLLALWHGFGILLYGILWMLMPPAKGRPSALDEVLETVRSLIGARERRANGEDREVSDPDEEWRRP